MWNVYRVDNARTVFAHHDYLTCEQWIADHPGIAYSIILDYPL